MSTNALTRTLQIAYPAVIFLAVLASARMSLVQAGSPDFNRRFPNQGNHRIDRTLVSAEVPACSLNDLRARADQGLCAQKTDSAWENVDDGRYKK